MCITVGWFTVQSRQRWIALISKGFTTHSLGFIMSLTRSIDGGKRIPLNLCF